MTTTPETPRPLPTAQDIADWFAAYDVIPVPMPYLDRQRGGRWCGCAVGVSLVHACDGDVEAAFDIRDRGISVVGDLHRHTGWPSVFIDGLDSGFIWGRQPDEKIAEKRDRCTSGERAGFDVGVAAWKLVNTHQEAP